MSTVTSETMTVTPAIAKRMLEKNILSNRRIKSRHLRKLIYLMKSGKWIINGDTIRFDLNGNLIDGQHRLKAIIESNTSQECIIVKGLSSNAIYTIDTSRAPRTLPDAFKIAGINNSTVFANACKYLDVWLRGEDEPKKLSHDEEKKQRQFESMIEFYHKNEKELSQIYKNYMNYQAQIKTRSLNASYVVAMIFYVRQLEKGKDTKYVYEFFQDLLECTKNRATEIPFLLRNEILHQDLVKDYRFKTGRKHQLVLSCIRHYKNNQTFKKLEVPIENMFALKSL